METNKMITFDEAFSKVMSDVYRMPLEEVYLEMSLNRVLGEDIISDIDMPPFDKSAMDGYACRREDLSNELKVIEVIPAGVMPKKKISENECSKIMTGAPVPDGANCVVMVEYTEEKDNIVKFTGEKTSNNICYKAEDIKKNDVVLKKGTIINPAEIAVLATAGYNIIKVAVSPRVGVIATGSELVNVSEKITGAKIRNSNGEQLSAQCVCVGCDVSNYGIANDTKEDIDDVIKEAMSENDLVILSGGVSMGDFDFVPGILKENDFEFLFESVAMQPGKPTIFGKHKNENIYCCGLPGNPVSTFIIFEILLRPFLLKMMGVEYNPKIISMPLGTTIKRKKNVRQASFPIKIQDGKLIPIDYHGSAHINAMSIADGIIRIPIGVSEIEKDEIVDAILF